MLPFFSFHFQIDAVPAHYVCCNNTPPSQWGGQSCRAGNQGGTAESGDVNMLVCAHARMREHVGIIELQTEEWGWSRVSKAAFRLIVESSWGTHTQIQRNDVPYLCVSIHRQDRKIMFSRADTFIHREMQTKYRCTLSSEVPASI